MDRKIRLPKDGFIDEQDVEGHVRLRVSEDQPGPVAGAEDDFRARVDGSEDTEGHRITIARAKGEAPETEDDDTEGHRMVTSRATDARETDDDTEGHIGRPGSPDDMTVLPAPPSIGLRRSPGHGGELTADDEDVEGHRIRP
jgi:hypothetical protein